MKSEVSVLRWMVVCMSLRETGRKEKVMGMGFVCSKGSCQTDGMMPKERDGRMPKLC